MQTHAFYLSQYLHTLGYQITLLTYYHEKESDETKAFDQCQKFQIHRVLSRIGYFYNIKTINDYVNEFKPHIIYGSTVFYGLARRLDTIPFICRSVGTDILRPWIGYPFRFGASIFKYSTWEEALYRLSRKFPNAQKAANWFYDNRYQIMCKAANKASLIFSNSAYTTNLLEKIGVPTARIQMLVGGVDFAHFHNSDKQRKTTARQRLNLPNNAFIIMTACRLVKKKGLEFLVRQFEKTLFFKPNSLLLIVGDGVDRLELERLSAQLKLSRKIRFAGKASLQQMAEYYQASDLFVLASKEHTNPRTGAKDIETMGRVLCEANASGIPVLASNSGGIPSVIKHGYNGLLFTEENSQEFLTGYNQLYRNANLTKYLVSNGIEMAKNQFDWSIILKRHEEEFIRLSNKS
jgi:glycosyltransferase involved in cell wall biosynthesis